MNDIFWPVFTAVLAANLLTVAFIWAGKHVGNREDNGIEVPSVYMMTFLLPIGFLLLGLWTL